MTAKLYKLKPQRPALNRACEWSSAIEHMTATNIRLYYAWQRIILRAISGV